MSIELNCLRVGMLMTNCYIVNDAESKQAVIVDPGDGAQFIESCMESLGVSPVAILLTHAHLDHIQAVPALKSRFNIPIYVHEADEEMLGNTNLNLGPQAILLEEGDIRLKGGETISLGGMEIKVIHTPGHTKGGVCYYFEEDATLLSGDTMFRNSWGRTDFPGGSDAEIMDSIRNKLLPLPKETKVYPGHEGATTIENERMMHGYRG